MSHRPLHADDDCVVSLHRYPPGYTMRAHEHSAAATSVVLEGHVWERVRRREEIGGPFSMVTKPAGVVHENRFGPEGARMLLVELSEGLSEALGMRAWGWGHGAELALPAARLVRAARRAAEGEGIGGALDDALATLTDETTGPRAAGTTPPRWLCDVRERLHDEVADTPSVAALADMAGVHRVTLARAFRQHLGCSTTDYLRQLRVRTAAAALATTDTPIVCVALDAGFADQSHLTRAMKEAVGTTPARFRAEVRG